MTMTTSLGQHESQPAAKHLRREEDRIVHTYEQRDAEALVRGFRNPLELFSSQMRERAVYWALARRGLLPLQDKRIVDFGCGRGARLRDFLRLGATPENLYGVDLLADRLDYCRRLSPNFNVQQCSAAATPFADGQFDIVLNSTMMSSVLDDELAAAIAREMMRVTSPRGAILWCDLRYRNPWNKNVRPYNRTAIRRLFAGWKVTAQSYGLPPQFSRLLGNRIWPYSMLHFAPPLRMSLVALIYR